ncbi:UDP-glucosyltransferase 2-like [Anticarsia gemmatalis]|uniref:UDP-glucosyltransferase 2-like n=1 Tax=Anticarsia gemmatalis TaxID=129554 RepID=UPI003F76B987
MWILKFLLVCLAAVSWTEAYKILVMYPFPARSHGILGDGFVRHLLNDGHEVTYISPYPYKAHPKLRLIDVSENIKSSPEHMVNLDNIMNRKVNFDSHALAFYFMLDIMTKTLENKNVLDFLNDPTVQFDAIIAEWAFNEVLAGLAAIYNCPFIWSSSIDAHWAIIRFIDQPLNPAYSADPISSAQPPFSFWQRAKELHTQLTVQFLKFVYFDGAESRVYENLLAPIAARRGLKPPSYYDLQYNASMILANSHTSLGQPNALPQNCILIGGYHIEEEVKPLPQDLKKLMDEAKHGVIYFSMGSNLKSKHLPQEVKDSLLKLFGGLKQTVLWKFEEDLPNTPPNVHIIHWAPQQSILAHPNLVLFITHGGLLSTTESIHFGVPIIGIPVFADQFVNIARAAQKGFAIQVDLSVTMANELKTAIAEMTSNPRYKEKAKQLSFIYHDRPVAPSKEFVHWVKHVIKTQGAPHLRSPALHVPFYQKLYLDLLLVILVSLYAGVKIIKFIRSSRSASSAKKRN